MDRRSAAGALSLRCIEAEMTPYAISTTIETAPNGPAVSERRLSPRCQSR
ncbi:hypothetical protein [Methylopila sp. 73B]|nr:hypothetical protein [Methylopila sp. 73B]